MPFTSGVFANVAGATSAAAGQTIQSVVWNNIHADYSTALNMLMGQLITSPSNRNIVWMNGGFEVWQRGAGPAASIAVAASTTTYTADRWYIATDANEASTVSAQTGLVDESRLCGRVQRDSGQTGTGVMRFAYPFDTDEIIRCRGNIVNLSFRVRAGANWSPASGTLSYALFTGTGASPAKRSGTPYTGDASAISSTVNLTTTTALVQASSAAVIPTGTTQMELQFNWTPVGTAGAADYFEIDDVQLECSLSPNTFTFTSYDRLDFATMLQGCKRHYQKTFGYSVAPAYGAGFENTLSAISTGTQIGYLWVYNPEMRVDPSILTYSAITATSSGWIGTNSSASSAAAINSTVADHKASFIVSGVVSAGIAQSIHADATAGI